MLLGGLEIPLWAILSLTLAILAYLYTTRTFNTFKKSGIPGPSPWPIVGTSLDFYSTDFMTLDTQMRKKYGKFVGTFEGSLPVLMVYDAEWLKEAFIKNFKTFTDRRPFALGGAFDEGLFSINGDHWKHARKMLSPEFSSGKLKKMMPAIQKCDDIFVKILRDTEGQAIDVRRNVNMLTLDVISQTAFGMDAEVQTNSSSQFAENTFRLLGLLEEDQTFLKSVKSGLAVLFFTVAPDWLQLIMTNYLKLGMLDTEAIEYFETMSVKAIESRKKDAPGTDFLQTLADSMVEAPKNDPDTLVDKAGLTWTKKGFTKQEVIGNVILFLFAGFATTADTLTYLFYELAMHPKVQQKLYEEIIAVCDTEEITMEQINQVKYLDYCIDEAMRLYPQSSRFDRVAAEDITIRDIHVAKGTAVTASGWVIHRDPEIWENPENYDPERFSPERMTEECTTAYMPFGMGNRQCIGSRLAMIEMKMTVISTLKAFRIIQDEKTPKRPLQFKVDFISLDPKETIIVKFESRSSA